MNNDITIRTFNTVIPSQLITESSPSGDKRGEASWEKQEA